MSTIESHIKQAANEIAAAMRKYRRLGSDGYINTRLGGAEVYLRDCLKRLALVKVQAEGAPAALPEGSLEQAIADIAASPAFTVPRAQVYRAVRARPAPTYQDSFDEDLF
jgi:hypothetical protein